MKLDIKSIIILALLTFSIIFFGLWYFKGSDLKSQIKELELENKKIENVRDSLKNEIDDLKVEFEKREEIISERDKKINLIESEINKTKKELLYANERVKNSQKELLETKKKIDELRNNPIKREGDDLIESLKNKIK